MINSICPIAYRYGAKSIKLLDPIATYTLYVVGGLYGNPHALNAIKKLFAAEKNHSRLCFNGDFHWFDIASDPFQQIQHSVMQHDAICGNVEYELGAENYSGGCGCSYPDSVAIEIAERSDAIHRRLSETARLFPEAIQYFSQLPMRKKYLVAGTTIAVVHGDADSLAGWNFDASMIDTDSIKSWAEQSFVHAGVDVFASSHTGSALMRRFVVDGNSKLVINNGAAGTPNFFNAIHGVITRISNDRYEGESLATTQIGDAWIDALPVRYDQEAWLHDFLNLWPAGSDAHSSYWAKMTGGPKYSLNQAYPQAI